ncbi:hypothetical protein [Allosediminivita pacifica]|uniref:Uncharacterized protein n=1 Tax=Allosediminivita pacifica TaxID=1267769 RepID=A0A2T6B2C0_9RHOB|nr:hypothetical protein [Allosediminivita pacifica]PTX50219.1 hypothetical protein C8N44_10579 [Allosediminivita pacifica]GGB02392.1 hypothetical protein GCM10011324_10750 [Allosediminivita pacifica]
MADLKEAILDAKYVDLIALGDFIARDCALPVIDGSGNALPQASELAAAMFRWAAGADPQAGAQAETFMAPASDGTVPFFSETSTSGGNS